ncbi:MAG TPA: lytic transglycosylase domain-containing protein [Nocardioides sp.]|nr:lytic transglycosylase domain-containing protein [Nocardioides sp.]
MPRHRAAPAPTQPDAWLGPRHVGDRRRPAQRALRTTVTVTGLAAAATGVAVATGMVQSPDAAANLADSLTTAASTGDSTAGHGAAAAAVQDRTPVVSRSADRTRLSPGVSGGAGASQRVPAKAKSLGLSTGPAVGGQENLAISGNPQTIALAELSKFGFSSSQMSCLIPLWAGESGWRVNAENSSSGAYGIPQALPGSKMASAGSDWQTNAATQIKWGLGYIAERYGSPCGAWGFKQSHGWY